MKKIILTLVVLLLAVPASAEVFVNCAADPPDSNGWVTISYDASGEVELPRAFALNILVTDGAAIVDVNDTINAFYTVNPGTIQIDSETGIVTDEGTAVAPGGDPESCSGDANCITIEMGSLYVGVANAPPDTGDLLRIQVDGNCDVVITGNTLRGDIVLEDVTVAEVNAPGCEVNDMDCYEGVNPTKWAELGKPESWCCTNQPNGDATGDGVVNVFDLIALKFAISGAYDCRVDFTHDGSINVFDLIRLKFNVGTNYGFTCASEGYDPSDCGP